jgi:hypothetical protein
VIVFNENSLRRILSSYCAYYQHWRTHLSWIKMLRKHEQYIRALPVKLSRRRTLAVCITIMNAELRDRVSRHG